MYLLLPTLGKKVCFETSSTSSDMLDDLRNLVRMVCVLQHRLPKTGWCPTLIFPASLPSCPEVFPLVAFFRRAVLY
jgi:hypothetical protein